MKTNSLDPRNVKTVGWVICLIMTKIPLIILHLRGQNSMCLCGVCVWCVCVCDVWCVVCVVCVCGVCGVCGVCSVCVCVVCVMCV